MKFQAIVKTISLQNLNLCGPWELLGVIRFIYIMLYYIFKGVFETDFLNTLEFRPILQLLPIVRSLLMSLCYM